MTTDKTETREDIATLKTQMSVALSELKQINDKLDNFYTSFVSRSEFNEFKSKSWYSHTLSAIAGAALVSLVAFFFNHFSSK